MSDDDDNFYSIGYDDIEFGKQIDEGDLLIHTETKELVSVGLGVDENGIKSIDLMFVTMADGSPHLVGMQGYLTHPDFDVFKAEQE